MKQKTLFVVAAVVLLLAFAGATLFYASHKQDVASQTAQQHQENLVRMHSPTLGPADASVHIVEFFDPACETCRDFYPFVKQLMAAHPGQVRLTLRYAPFHDGSDYVVKVLEAARRQGKYWETLERLYDTQGSWTEHHRVLSERVLMALDGIGLDAARLAQDLQAPEIAALIARDLDDAHALKVTMTPEFFVNGQPLPSFGRDQLQSLVEAAVAGHAR